MSQVPAKVRLKAYVRSHLDEKAWDKMVADRTAGKRVSGIIKVDRPVPSVVSLATAAHKLNENEIPATGLENGTVTSFRNGLLEDAALLYAETTVLKVDGNEIAGNAWMAEKMATSKKLRKADFPKILDDAIKADKKILVHRGVQLEMDKCIVEYSTGKKGKQKKSIVKMLADI